eukprot:gene22041-29106_t
MSPLAKLPEYSALDYGYDAMHAVGNVFADLRGLWLGKARVFKMSRQGNLAVFIGEEQNKTLRFHEWDVDDSATAPFVLRRGFQAIAHKRLGRATIGAGQTWNDSTSWHKAFQPPDSKGNPGYLDKHDWWLLSGPLMAYALAGAWSCTLAMDGVEAIVMDEESRQVARANMVVALATFESLLPTVELDMKLHQLDHISRNLPCGWYLCWLLERSIRFATSHIKKQAHATASAAVNLARAMGTRLENPIADSGRRLYDDVLEFTTHRPDPDVVMSGSTNKSNQLQTKDLERNMCLGPSKTVIEGNRVNIGGIDFRSVLLDKTKRGVHKKSTASYFAAKYVDDM